LKTFIKGVQEEKTHSIFTVNKYTRYNVLKILRCVLDTNNCIYTIFLRLNINLFTSTSLIATAKQIGCSKTLYRKQEEHITTEKHVIETVKANTFIYNPNYFKS